MNLRLHYCYFIFDLLLISVLWQYNSGSTIDMVDKMGKKYENTQKKFNINKENGSIDDISKNKVNLPIEFIEHPQDTYATKQPANVRCVVKNVDTAYIECNNEIKDYKSDVTEPSKTLIASVTRKDIHESKHGAGRSKPFTCVCVALNENKEKIFSKKAIVRISYLEEEFQSEPMDETAYQGDTIELRCDPPRGDPTPTVFWMKNDRAIDTLEEIRYKISNDNSLLILAVNKGDEAYYVCIAQNIMEKRLSKPARLTVLDKDKKYLWSEWGEWSVCSANCGEGIIKRTRLCLTSNNDNVSLSLCGNYDQSIEYESCVISSCPTKGQWSNWSSWSSCTNECKQYKVRQCESNGNIINDKYCEKGEKLITRNCNTTKNCKEKHIHPPNVDQLSKLTMSDQYSIAPKSDSFNIGTLIDKNMLGFAIGIAVGLLLLLIVIIIIVVVIKRRHVKKPEFNLYYTCEKPILTNKRQKNKLTELCCTEASSTEISQTINKSNRIVIDNNGHLFNNTSIERQLLLTNVPSNYQNESGTNNFETAILYNIVSNNLSEYEQPSPCLQNSHPRPESQTAIQQKDSPTNRTTSTTVDSSPSSTYYSTPSQNTVNMNGVVDCCKIVQVNSLKFSNNNHSPPPLRMHQNTMNNMNQVAFVDQIGRLCKTNKKTVINHGPTLKRLNQDCIAAQSSPTLNSFDSPRTALKNRVKKKHISHQSSVSKSTPDLINNLLSYVYPSDICVEKVSSAGAKLCLECGITLLIPENAFLPNQVEIVYLAICRKESSKPKLNEKSTLLSSVIMVGPPKLTLLKPIVLLIDHCAKNINTDWNVTLYSARNDDDLLPVWKLELNDTNVINENVFLNITEKHFILLSDTFARFSFTGESKTDSIASKYFRLVIFCSSSITSDDFNLRIYCVDDLKLALQEIIRDEEKIGGTIVDNSEPFPIAYIENGDSLCICINEINTEWNCKYNINRQEIPLNHIWNGRNNLLHCSFTMERNTADDEQLTFSIEAFQLCNLSSILVKKNIVFNMNNLLNINQQSEIYDTASSKNLNRTSWLFSLKRLSSYKTLKTYPQMSKNIKQQICRLLDNQNQTEKSWKTLAQKLAINKNLQYFSMKQSPTETLLFYLEAINYLRLLTTTRLNSSDDSTSQEHDNQNENSSQNFSNYFLSYISDNSQNSNFVNLNYANNY